MELIVSISCKVTCDGWHPNPSTHNPSIYSMHRSLGTSKIPARHEHADHPLSPFVRLHDGRKGGLFISSVCRGNARLECSGLQETGASRYEATYETDGLNVWLAEGRTRRLIGWMDGQTVDCDCLLDAISGHLM